MGLDLSEAGGLQTLILCKWAKSMPLSYEGAGCLFLMIMSNCCGVTRFITQKY